MKLSFPRFSRLFSALVLALLLVGLFWVNRYASSIYKSASDATIYTLLTRAFSARTHLTLAQTYKKNNDVRSIDQEIALTKDLISKSPESVLGVTQEISSEIATWELEPTLLRKRLEYWEGIIARHPDYRDAYLQAEYIVTILQDKTSALEFRQKAKRLDPLIGD